MNTATPTPIRPSRMFQPVRWHRMVAMSTAPVLSTSLRLSAAVAMRVSEPMVRPMVRLKPVSYTHLDVYKRQHPGCLRISTSFST